MNDIESLFENADKKTKEEKPIQPFLSKEEYMEKKRLEKEEAYSLLDKASEEMTSSGDKFKELLDVMSRFDRYSPGNILLIAYQMPEATRLADFSAWKDKDAYINKGEKAITIFEPGNEFTREDGSTAFNMNVKKVFDVSQTDQADKQTERPKPGLKDAMKALLSASPCGVVLVNELPDHSVRYIPEDNVIYVKRGIDDCELFRVLAYEIGIADHSKIGVDRTEANFPSYCAAYIICERNGIDTVGFNFDKVPDMFRDKEPKEIRKTVSEIRNNANDIIKEMIKDLNNTDKNPHKRDDGAR